MVAAGRRTLTAAAANGLTAARAQKAGEKAGLSNGSLAAIHKEWREVFGVPAPGPADPTGAAAAARRASVQAIAGEKAVLSFVAGDGVVVTKPVTMVTVEEVDWDDSGGPKARVTFEYDGDPLETLLRVDVLEAAIAAGDGVADAARKKREAEEAAKAAREQAEAERRSIDQPRAEALASRALNSGEFNKFLTQAIPYYSNSSLLQSFEDNPNIARTYLEGWLVSLGEAGEAGKLAGDKG